MRKLAAILCLFTSQAFAATYYVSDSDGNDGDDGLTEGNAWATISKVNGETFSPGDIILFKRGDTWRETLIPPDSGSSGNPITFGAYGTGDKPKISGANLVSTWSATTESTGPDSGDLLSDNFDDNDISDWETPVGTPVAQNERLEVTMNGGGDRTRHSYTTDTEVWASWDQILVSGYTWSDAAATQGGGITRMTGSHHVLYVCMINDGGDIKWRVRHGTDAAPTAPTVVDTDVIVTADVAHKIVVHWKAATSGGANDGVAEVWIDGEKILDVSDADTDTMTATGVLMGSNFSDSGINAVTYIDNLEVGTSGSDPVSADVWQASVTTEPEVVVLDGTYGRRQEELGTVSEEYEWFWESNLLYVNAPSDPDSLYVSPGIESGARSNALYFDDTSYLTFDDISFYIANHSPVFMDGTSSNHNFTDCVLYGGFYYGIWSFVPESTTDVIIDGCEVSFNSYGIVINPSADDWTIKNNILHNNSIVSVVFDPTELIWGAAIRMVSNTAAVDNVVIENNHIYDEGKLEDGTRIDDGTVNKGYGIWLDLIEPTSSSEGAIIRYNRVHDGNSSGIFIEKTLYAQVYYNLSYGNENATDNAYGIRVDADEDGRVAENVIYNNTTYGNDINIYLAGGFGQTGDHFDDNIVRNNIAFGSLTGTELMTKWGAENDGTMGTGNIYTHNMIAEGTDFVSVGDPATEYDTIAAWEAAASGTIEDNLGDDPLFVDAPVNFSLQLSSPAINAGTSVGLTQDIIGTAVPQFSVVDIGAYEQGSCGAYFIYGNFVVGFFLDGFFFEESCASVIVNPLTGKGGSAAQPVSR